MRGDGLLGVLAQVVPQVPAVRDLDGERSAGGGAVAVRRRPVSADDLRAGAGLQPVLQRGGLTVGQQVDDLPGLGVGDHGAVDVALAQREVVHPGDLRRGRHHGIGQRHDQPQERGGVDRDAQGGGQPGTRPPGQLQPEAGQQLPQRQGPPQVAAGQPVRLLDERDPRAGRGLQRNRRTDRAISTGRPPAAPSATSRW